MKAEFRVYRTNGERDVLRWKQRLDVADDLSEEAVFDLFKQQFLLDAKEITFAETNHYRTEKRGDLVFRFWW